MYKFNGGRGAVICDQCSVIYDADLSYQDYEVIYVAANPDGDFCWKCRSQYMCSGCKKSFVGLPEKTVPPLKTSPDDPTKLFCKKCAKNKEWFDTLNTSIKPYQK